jgi:hypothetical protein
MVVGLLDDRLLSNSACSSEGKQGGKEQVFDPTNPVACLVIILCIQSE